MTTMKQTEQYRATIFAHLRDNPFGLSALDVIRSCGLALREEVIRDHLRIMAKSGMVVKAGRPPNTHVLWCAPEHMLTAQKHYNAKRGPKYKPPKSDVTQAEPTDAECTPVIRWCDAATAPRVQTNGVRSVWELGA
jgi:hypothetical protein